MSIDVSRLTPLDVSKLQIARLPEGMFKPVALPAEFTALAQPPAPPQNIPPDETYAQVKVGGRVVATLSNNGYATTDNADAKRFQDIFADDQGLSGPALAQSRADRIAALVGGQVVKADTALTQSAWQAQRNAYAQNSQTPQTPASYQRPLLAPGLSILLTLGSR